MQKLITNTRKTLINIKNHHIFNVGIFSNIQYGLAMFQKFSVNDFEWLKILPNVMKKFFQESYEGYFLEFDVQYPENLPIFINIKKYLKLVSNLHIRNLKKALNHGLVLKILRKTIKFNPNAWLKPYTDMNTDLRKKQIMILKKIFLS